MKIRQAETFDIENIMKTEKNSFILPIQEEKSVFLNRIKAFPEGFLIFLDEKTNSFAGYFCSELWTSLPTDYSVFTLGHNINDYLNKNGKTLYISSFALLNTFRGKGNGKKAFFQALEYVENHFELDNIILLVNDIWQNAKKIYKSAEFIETSRILKTFPSETESFTDGIVMVKNVSKQKIF